jgi:hypothetical protein
MRTDRTTEGEDEEKKCFSRVYERASKGETVSLLQSYNPGI